MSVNALSDQELVKGYILGNSNCFEKLLFRHKDKIYAFIVSKVRSLDLAEDLFHDTLIKVINSLKKGKYNEEGKFISWVMRIAHNLIIDHFRKISKQKYIKPNNDFDIFDIIENGEMSQEQRVIQKQIHRDLNKIIDQLPDDQKEVVKLRYFEDMSFKKISNLTGVSINTSLGRMRYALINIRRISKKYNIDLQLF
jgi:RNA polymerase sigma-70 factor (ECF subfamily)